MRGDLSYPFWGPLLGLFCMFLLGGIMNLLGLGRKDGRIKRQKDNDD